MQNILFTKNSVDIKTNLYVFEYKSQYVSMKNNKA